MTTDQFTQLPNHPHTVINLTTERVIRMDVPSFLQDPLGYTRALPQQIPVVVPAEPAHFKEWLDAEQAKLVECEDFVDYLDRFLEE
jgi:hypothetical protein